MSNFDFMLSVFDFKGLQTCSLCGIKKHETGFQNTVLLRYPTDSAGTQGSYTKGLLRLLYISLNHLFLLSQGIFRVSY